MIFHSPGPILFTLYLPWYIILAMLVGAGVIWYQIIKGLKLTPWSMGWTVTNVVFITVFTLFFKFRLNSVMQMWSHFSTKPLEILTTWDITIPVRWYGILIAGGFCVGAYLGARLAKRWNMDIEEVTNLCLISFMGGVLGGRLYFVMLNWKSFFAQPWEEVFAMWHGGMSIHGGLIGGFLTAAIFGRYAKLPVMRCLDLGACALPMAQAIGRWGNFFNQEAFGKPVPENFPVKLLVDQEYVPDLYFNHHYFHPTFLYESIWNLIVCLFLYFVVSKKLVRYPGLTFLIYIDLYSLGRLMIEPIRVDSIMAGTIPVPIIASAASLVAASAAALLLIRHYKKHPYVEPVSEVPTAETEEKKPAIEEKSSTENDSEAAH